MEAAGAGAEVYVAVLAVGGLGAVPKACAAVDAFFSFEFGDAVVAGGDGLAGAHGDAGFLGAGDAEVGVAEGDVVSESGEGLDFAAEEEGILLGDEEAAVEGNFRPAAGGEQGVVERAAVGEGEGGGVFELEAGIGGDLLVGGGGCVRRGRRLLW